MADGFVKQIETLHEEEFVEKCVELTEEVLLHLKIADVSVEAKIISSFLKKIVCNVTEIKTVSIFKALLPAAERICNSVFQDLQKWEDVGRVLVLLQVIVI